jgi:hypothetical protein
MLHLERAPYFRGLLRRQKVAIAGQYAGEMRHAFDEPNLMKSYVAKRGLKLDEVGQLLWDCGLVESRPGLPDEVLEVLAQALTYKPERKSSTTVRLAEMLSDGKLYHQHQIRRALSMGPDADVGRLIRRLRQNPYKVEIRKVPTASGLRYGVASKDLDRLRQYAAHEAM